MSSFYIWIIINILFIGISSIFIWTNNSELSFFIEIGQTFAQIAIILFIININMYFIFLVIRKTKVRSLKVSLSKFSRKFMKWHIPLGLLGTSIIILHGGIMLIHAGPVLSFDHIKMISGYLSLAILAITLIAGYLRHKKSSGPRRKFHLYSSFVFLLLFLFHLFIPMN